jgi:hypothetical protein
MAKAKEGVIKVFINGKKCYFINRHALARHLMDLLENSIAPLSSRAENLQRIMEVTGFHIKAKYIGEINTEERYTKAYWETILSLEHKSTLPGFSVNCNIGKGRSNYNPEKVRISTDWNI